MSRVADYDVLVKVVFGTRAALLWQRWEPAWHPAESYSDETERYGHDAELAYSDQPAWRWRNGKTMRRARFHHG